MTRWLRILLALALAIGLLELGPRARVARAALVSTEAVLGPSAAVTAERERIRALFSRQDVRRELEALGVDPDRAKARVELLSDPEVETLVGKLDALPAGGSDVVTVLLIIAVVFLVLIFTDAVGVTDLFPWVNKPQQR
jgi:hypothetical protein